MFTKSSGKGNLHALDAFGLSTFNEIEFLKNEKSPRIVIEKS